MTEPVPRIVSVIEEGSEGRYGTASKRLATYRDCPAYVLLGSPGAGKTTAFRQEADAHENGEWISARDFIGLENPGWSDKLLFIDGLDEMRAGAQDGRTPIDQIRSKLQRLGCSRFRLSCRTMDWWWTNDRQKLEQIGTEVLLLALDPLADESVPEILRQNDKPKNGDPEEFISQARAHGLGEWLKNPQTLLLLAESIDEQGGWPHSRRELYEKACETLLAEPNEEYIRSGASQASRDTLLKTAGRMCAVQLLSGGAGYTLPPGKPSRDYPALLAPVVPTEVGKQTARTRAFDKIPDREQVVPEHQCTAEFLGGRYLAKQVEQGFSADRILALMSSADKVVVPKLQGIAAWFAVYSHPARKKLIENTPLEIILYGDVGSFDVEDKRRLLDRLREKTSGNPWSVRPVRRNTPLHGLASPDLHEDLKAILMEPEYSEGGQAFRYLVLQALRGDPVVPEFPDVLLEIIRNEKSWPANQQVALEVLLRDCPYNTDAVERLKILLEEVQGGAVRDFQGRLLDTLLSKLYPEHISAYQAVDYLVDSRQPPTAGIHTAWTKRLVKQAGWEQLTELLNNLAIRVDEVRKPKRTQTSFRLFGTFLAILGEVLSSVRDEEIDIDDLRHWLETASCSKIRHTMSGTFRQAAASIHEWLENRPDAQRVIFKSGVREWISTDDFKLRAYETGNWLFRLPPALDFWPWCLDLAVQEKNPKAAQFFLQQITNALSQENVEINLSLDDLRAKIARHPELEKDFKAVLVCELSEDYFKEIETRQRRIAMDLDERERTRQDWVERTKAQEVELRQNRGSPKLLHDLAIAYFGGFYDAEGDQPRERLHNLLNGDRQLIQVVLDAFRETIDRQDLPGMREILRLAKRNQYHALTFPCLAGLKEMGAPPATNQKIRRALALHYFADYAIPGEERPAWYESLLAEHPGIVSDILVKCLRFQIRKREEHLTDSHELAFSESHTKVARLAALPLLRSFPIRCTTPQLRGLGYLLSAALLHCKRSDLRALLKIKLAEQRTAHMNVGQHVYWLAAGLLAFPKTYRRKLEPKIQKSDSRMRHFVEFVCQGNHSTEWGDLLAGPCLESLVQLIGSSFRDVSPDEGMAWSSPPMAASFLIRGLIDHLADDPTPDATDTLGRLATDESLSKWSTHLQNAADEQHSLRRQSEFKHRSVSEIIQALDQKKPASMDDLVVLLLEDLNEMGEKIRDGSTNDWHQYWNQSPRRNPEEWSPKYEADCRDALLSDLQEKLRPLDINAHREGSYADDTRADIQVSYESLNLPIEVKKNHSEDLWKGIREQLIPKYSRDPGADGRGIFLVFWFGEDSRKNPDTGARPASPEELRDQLEGSLTPEEADKVSIHVIDVARP